MSKLPYNYIQQSQIATYKFQRSLPRLKIPKLEKTRDRYLQALDPVFKNDPRLAKCTSVAKDFFRTQGRDLHAQLLAYDKTVKHTSYINQFWFDMYLSSRAPLPLNFNPFLAWKDFQEPQMNNQVVKSSNFIISAIRFKNSLEANLLEPEIFHLNPKKTTNSQFYKNAMKYVPESIATYLSFAFKAFPLDMSQYKNLFNSTRIPKIDKDIILKSDSKINKHVLVIKNGQFYVFDVLDSDGDLLHPEAIYANVHHIANQSSPKLDYLSISELTTANRDFWAKEREHLVSLSEKNRANLEKLDSAIFAICLDDCSFEPHQIVEGAHNFLHGCHTKKQLNRWFDKSFSIIVTKEGHSCINFEHSWGDGVAILRFFNDTYSDIVKNPSITSASSSPKSDLISTKRLDFDLDSRLKDSIQSAKRENEKSTSNLELSAVKYDKLNRDYFKKNKLSPDSMSQLSFQLAFKKAYNKTPVTYESCSTAAFKGGRTETVRPCTNETNEACEAILSNEKSLSNNAELKELLKKCSGKHYQLCKEASMGDGFDRHLFAMKELGTRANIKQHDFFLDPIHLENQSYTLSTSTLYGESFEGGGFAPVAEDGFGLGYGYVGSSFGVLISSYKTKRSNTQFAQALEDSLDNIRKIVET